MCDDAPCCGCCGSQYDVTADDDEWGREEDKYWWGCDDEDCKVTGVCVC